VTSDRARRRCSSRQMLSGCIVLFFCSLLAPALRGQSDTPLSPTQSTAASFSGTRSGTGAPLAIVSVEGRDAPQVTGSLNVTAGRAMIGASGTVTAGNATAEVVLPRRGVLRVCATTCLQLAVNANGASGDVPGLMMALDHGAIETSFAIGRNADVILTPDFRIRMDGAGTADVKIRLGQNGDTCVDNASASAQQNSSLRQMDVVVSSVFEGGAYRVLPGQRVMFEHGSLREVVDQEKEPCGCPSPIKPESNEFPLAQSAGLAPLPAQAEGTRWGASSARPGNATVNTPVNMPANGQIDALTYNAAKPPASPTAATAAVQSVQSVQPRKNKISATGRTGTRAGFFHSIGHFFSKLFGAEE